MTKIYYDLPFKIKEPDAVSVGVYNGVCSILLWPNTVLTLNVDGSRKWRRRHFDSREITEEEALQEVGL